MYIKIYSVQNYDKISCERKHFTPVYKQIAFREKFKAFEIDENVIRMETKNSIVSPF
jgi:hypothetical protein